MILVVTGTGTDVGKTVVTAALAACAAGRVAVVKPAQTGMRAGEPGDLAEVTRLGGVADVHEFARYPDPLAPHHAAALSGLPELDRDDVVRRVSTLARERDTVIVEGAGGLLVPFAADGWTLLDLVAPLDARVVLVTNAGLGTLSHTATALHVLRAAGVDGASVVIGAWPEEPDLAARCNVDDLAAMSGGGQLAGAVPLGASNGSDFRLRAPGWLGPSLGGRFDADAFAKAVSPWAASSTGRRGPGRGRPR